TTQADTGSHQSLLHQTGMMKNVITLAATQKAQERDCASCQDIARQTLV
ncbi:MAG: hypothetical protein ACI8UP_003176, partial [Porticoccaceae bacterium]